MTLRPPFLGFAVGVNDGIMWRPLPGAINVPAAGRKHHVTCRRAGRPALRNIQVVIPVMEKQLRRFKAIALSPATSPGWASVRSTLRGFSFTETHPRKLRHGTARQIEDAAAFRSSTMCRIDAQSDT